MPIQYAGGTNVKSDFTQSAGSPTRREIVDGIVAAMTTAGWSVISGSGTGDVMMESATTPASQSLNMRARIYDPGSGTAARIKIRNAGGTRVQTGDFELVSAAGRLWRVIANKYQVFVFTPNVLANCTFAAWGVPFIPTFLEGVLTECIWGWSASNNSSDLMRPCFRNALAMWVNFSTPNFCAIVDGSTWEFNNSNQSSSNLGLPGLFCPAGAATQNNGVSAPNTYAYYRWHDDTALLGEPLICFGKTGLNNEGKIRGQLWDAVVASDAYDSDRVVVIDSKNFYNITHNNYGQALDAPRGSLWVVVP